MWTAVVEESDGELYIVLPDELVETLGWQEGDNIEWQIDENSVVTVRKVDVGAAG